MVISVTYFDATNHVYRSVQPQCIFLVYGWSFISVLQLSAWSLVPMLCGILLCYIPVQLYILFGYRGYTIAYLKDCYGKREECIKRCLNKDTLVAILFSTLMVLVFYGVHVILQPKNVRYTHVCARCKHMVDSSFAGRACPTDLSQPCHCYLTLPEDGSTKMFVNVHVKWKQFEDEEIDIEYWEVENGSKKVAKTMSLTTATEWLEENGKRMCTLYCLRIWLQTVYEFALQRLS